MPPGFRLALAVAFYFALGTAAHADLPLTIEDVIAKEHELTIELGFDYGNLYTSDFVEKRNQDLLSTTLGIRYGLTPRTEIYGGIRGNANQTRVSTGRVRSHASNGLQWRSLTIGLNHRFSPDNDTPALLGYLQSEVIENATFTNQPHAVYGKTWEAGVTTYRRVDPVVFSLSAGFRYSRSRDMNGVIGTITPGNTVRLSAKMNLALNAEASMFWGTRWSYQSGMQMGGHPIEINATQTSLLLGGAYAVSPRTTLHFDLSADISGRGGGNLGTLFRHTF